VFVARGCRAIGWEVAVPRPGVLLVSASVLDAIRAGRVCDAEVSVLVAHALGQLPGLGSRAVLAVEIYCLPWTIARAVAGKVANRLARTPLMSFSWKLRPVVLGLGLLDAVQHGRWEAAIPLIVLAVLTYTTGPLDQAWTRKLDELGDHRVIDEGLGPFARMVLDPRLKPDRRRADIPLEARQ